MKETEGKRERRTFEPQLRDQHGHQEYWKRSPWWTQELIEGEEKKRESGVEKREWRTSKDRGNAGSSVTRARDGLEAPQRRTKPFSPFSLLFALVPTDAY